MSKLTDAVIAAAPLREKAYKIADGDSLFIQVSKTGVRSWYWRYHFGGKERRLSIGVWPDVSINKARHLREEAAKQLAANIDPGRQRRMERRQLQVVPGSASFRGVAAEWLDLQTMSASTRAGAERMLGYLNKRLGDRPVDEITVPELLAVLQEIEAPLTPGGKRRSETAHRCKHRAAQVFQRAIVTGRAKDNPAMHLRGALAPVKVTNRAALTDPRDVGDLLRAIDGYQGQPATVAALKLAPMVFLRPGELRKAEWREIDLETRTWIVPAARMKMRKEHLVPLAKQAVRLLKALKPITGNQALVFPSLRPGRPLSENTLNVALRTMGYSGEQMTAHGFRALASTLLHEQGIAPEVIELQLAHAQRNQVAAAYNRSARLEERRRMMQKWADYLDRLAVT